MERKRYPTDVTDAEWRIIEPLLPPANHSPQSHQEQQREDGDARPGGQAGMAACPLADALAGRRVASMAQRQVVQLPLQVFLELAGRLVASARLGLQTMADD